METSKSNHSGYFHFRDFLVRTIIFLPMVIFAILFVLMLFGIAADLLGATTVFYCTIYCKICVGLLALGAAGVLYCQVKACWKKK